MGCIKSKNQNVFRIPLADVPRHDVHVLVPKIVVECIELIERTENINTDGIYRISGSKSDINKLIEKVSIQFVTRYMSFKLIKLEFQIDKNNDYKAIHMADIHVVAGVFKAFFRELKSNLIPPEMSEYLLKFVTDRTNIHTLIP